jgi:hypothetical protein
VTTPVPRWRRPALALLAVGAAAGALTGCTGGASDSRSAMQATEAAPAPAPVTPSATPTAAGETAPSGGVACDVHTCTLTLRTTDPRELRAFGATLALDDVADGVASLTVGDGAVECRADESVEAGPLTLFCDDVTADSVRLTAEVG